MRGRSSSRCERARHLWRVRDDLCAVDATYSCRGDGVKRDDTNERFDYGNVIAPDKQSNSKEWKTVTQDSKEFCTSFAMKGGLQNEALVEYRNRWTRDTAEGASVRFPNRAF